MTIVQAVTASVTPFYRIFKLGRVFSILVSALKEKIFISLFHSMVYLCMPTSPTFCPQGHYNNVRTCPSVTKIAMKETSSLQRHFGTGYIIHDWCLPENQCSSLAVSHVLFISTWLVQPILCERVISNNCGNVWTLMQMKQVQVHCYARCWTSDLGVGTFPEFREELLIY